MRAGALERYAGWLSAPATPRRAYAIATAIGLALFLVVLGPGYLFGTSSYWDLPTDDTRAYLIGYRYFLHEPWHWPVFVTHTMNVPYTKGIAFTDSLPLWAFINKLFATIPPWRDFSERAYLGVWYAICFVLQPCFGVALLRTLGRRTHFAAILTALFFVAVPAWAFRFFHASLFAQWLTLWALLLYLRTPSKPTASRGLRAVQLVQLGIVATINPYHTVMSLGVFTASLLRSRTWRQLLWLPAGLATVLCATWLVGYYADDAKLHMFGYDVASANVLGILFTRRSGLFGEAAWVDPTGYQYEGLCYLGAGFLGLLAIYATRFRAVPALIARHRWLFVVAFGAWLFSLSTHVYAGPRELFTHELPKSLHWIADQFRCPGRFVWLPMYVLMVVVLSSALGRAKTGWMLVVLPVLAVLQLADVSGYWQFVRGQTDNAIAGPLAVGPAQDLVDEHVALRTWPSYDCLLDAQQSTAAVSLELQYLASRRAIPVNGVYSARPTRDCVTDAQHFDSLSAEPGTLYVLSRRLDRIADRIAASGATCGELPSARLCSTVPGAIDRAIRAGILAPTHPFVPTPLAYGRRLDVGDATTEPLLEDGWSYPTTVGRWTDGPRARLRFELVGSVPETPTLYLQASAALCGSRTQEDVVVRWNGAAIGTLHFDRKANDRLAAHAIPIGAITTPSIELELEPSVFRSPGELGCNRDHRALGVRVTKLWIDNAAPSP